MNYSTESEARWFFGRLNAHLDEQAAAEARAMEEEEFAEAHGMTVSDLDEALYPEDYVSEADYFAPTEEEQDALNWTLAWGDKGYAY